VQANETLSVFETDGADRGQFEPRDLLEQRRLGKLLETLDLQADGWLRATELLRRPGESARLDDGDKRPEDIHGNAAHRSRSESLGDVGFLAFLHGFAPAHNRRIVLDRPMFGERPRGLAASEQKSFVCVFSISPVIHQRQFGVNTPNGCSEQQSVR